MLVCPYCQQEDVWEVELRVPAHRAIMCLECDTVWHDVADVRNGVGRPFDEVMLGLGMVVEWDAIKKLRHL